MEQRLRVEELAGRADVSVDTIRFYQKRRPVAPPLREGRVAWYGTRTSRALDPHRELQREGTHLALIERSLNGDIDATRPPARGRVAAADVEAPG